MKLIHIIVPDVLFTRGCAGELTLEVDNRCLYKMLHISLLIYLPDLRKDTSMQVAILSIYLPPSYVGPLLIMKKIDVFASLKNCGLFTKYVHVVTTVS